MTIFRIGTTSTTKLSIEADGSEDIVFTNGRSNLLTISNSGINISSGAFKPPAGNTSSRPSDPQVGEIRFNTTIGKLEGYNGSFWANIEA